MLGSRYDLVGPADLHNLSRVDDGDPIGHHSSSRQVVGDEHHGQAQLPAELPDQVEDDGTQRDVERAGRFVGQEETGGRDDRSGEGDPLSLAP